MLNRLFSPSRKSELGHPLSYSDLACCGLTDMFILLISELRYFMFKIHDNSIRRCITDQERDELEEKNSMKG